MVEKETQWLVADPEKNVQMKKTTTRKHQSLGTDNNHNKKKVHANASPNVTMTTKC